MYGSDAAARYYMIQELLAPVYCRLLTTIILLLYYGMHATKLVLQTTCYYQLSHMPLLVVWKEEYQLLDWSF